MKPMNMDELDLLLARDPDYATAERELRPDLSLAGDVITLRVDAGWSQAELAAQVGTNQANISRLEGALANPTLKFLKKVARALGAELDVRLRRPADSPETDTMEAFIADLTARTEMLEGTMDWQAYAPSRPIFEVSTRNEPSC